jgi:hypothetical protein
VQELNGINMGRILHSINACIGIDHHTASEVRNNLGKKLRSKSRISLIIDESTTLSKEIYIDFVSRAFIPNCGMGSPMKFLS